MQLDRGKGGIFVDHSADGLVCQCPAGHTDKKMTALLDFRKKMGFILIQEMDDIAVSDLYPPFLGAFSVDQDVPVLRIDIACIQGAKLRDPHPSGEKRFNDSGITEGAFSLVIRFSIPVLLVNNPKE